MVPAVLASPSPVVYPESDGKSLADNTKQARWIVLLFNNLCSRFREAADVFVALDLLWYAEENNPKERVAPDVFVAFGRPKGDRGSYKQWEEGDVPPTVVFEILSPGNTVPEMIKKFDFYEEHGVEEYYLYDPENNQLTIYARKGTTFVRHRPAHNFVSPRLGIRFDLSGEEMVVRHPDGRPFGTLEGSEAAHAQTRRQLDEARRQADQARQQADQARQQADQARHLASRMAELGRKARQGQASPDELAELDRLEAEAAKSVE